MYILTWILQTLVWVPTRLVFILLTRIKVKGRTHLKRLHGPVIFASNHPSEVDPILLPMALNPFSPFFPIFYVARKTGEYRDLNFIKRIIYGGWFFKIWGAYPTHRGKKDYEHSLQEHIKLLRDGKNVQIFLDGHLTPETVLFSEHPHGGTSYLSWRTNVRVVPMAIKGTHKTSPLQFFTGRRRYAVAFGKPLTPKELFDEDAGTDTEPTVREFQSATKKVIDRVRELHRDL